MGTYLNPGNKGFQKILQSEYVDKTGMIALINKTIGTSEMLLCISRPRRFGKSYATKMLCAYYDCSCDSRGLFDDREVARTPGNLTHLNQYHVINLDITGFISEAKKQRKPLADVPERIVEAVHKELKDMFPELPEGGKPHGEFVTLCGRNRQRIRIHHRRVGCPDPGGEGGWGDSVGIFEFAPGMVLSRLSRISKNIPF